MTDDRTKTASPNTFLINTNDDDEVGYWAKKFGVSEQRLAAAVRRVGSAAAAVEAELNK